MFKAKKVKKVKSDKILIFMRCPGHYSHYLVEDAPLPDKDPLLHIEK